MKEEFKRKLEAELKSIGAEIIEPPEVVGASGEKHTFSLVARLEDDKTFKEYL